mmetsp:Transcript_7987/g.15671  ORF Transcript_7987/g.15671 Transcript_7987/m.15671 type:complete len:428 (-) Transcript_7987:515-1798(-)
MNTATVLTLVLFFLAAHIQPCQGFLPLPSLPVSHKFSSKRLETVWRQTPLSTGHCINSNRAAEQALRNGANGAADRVREEGARRYRGGGKSAAVRMQVDTAGERRGKVCVVGSINYDQTVYVSKMPVPGQTLHGSLYTTGFGGKGANQCVMAGLMGAKCEMVGMLGTDDIATITRTHLAKVGVGIDHVGSAEGASGVAAITVSSDGENVVIVVPGANLLLTSEHIAKATSTIQSSSVLLCQNEVPPATTLSAMKAGKGKGPFVILNAAPAPSVGNRWQEGQWEDIGSMLSACDLLCINESETLLLTGVTVGEGDALVGSLQKAAERVKELGCPRVIFTLGAAGSCLVDEANQPVMVPLTDRPEKVVDTCGAGDSYLGALAAYLSFGVSLPDAMTKAGRVAAITVTGAGAQTSYPQGDMLPSELRLPA